MTACLNCLQGIPQEKQQGLFERSMIIDIEFDAVIQVALILQAEEIRSERRIRCRLELAQLLVYGFLRAQGQPRLSPECPVNPVVEVHVLVLL